MLDTHCHIDLYKDPVGMLKYCEHNKITVLSMTNLPSHFEMGLPFFKMTRFTRISLGMHPLYAEFHQKEFSLFEKNLSETSYIGEVGLDFSKDGISTKDIQIQSFERVLKLIYGQKKILSVHSRRAEKEVLQLMIKYEAKNAIFHWYSGGINLIKEISSAGYFFSINPAMIKSSSGQKIISCIPIDKVLTETDGPFIDNNNQPFKPGEIDTVVEYLSRLWGKSIEESLNIIKNNFRRLIKEIKD